MLWIQSVSVVKAEAKARAAEDPPTRALIDTGRNLELRELRCPAPTCMSPTGNHGKSTTGLSRLFVAT